MFRKILTYVGWFLLLALFSSYFFFAHTLKKNGETDDICTHIEVNILDSAINRFVDGKEVKGIIEASELKIINNGISNINLHDVEMLLNQRSAIKYSDVSIDREGVMRVDITQRRPLLRIQHTDGGFYVDESCYLFPLVSSFTSHVPIVTGDIPINIKRGQRGRVDQEEEKWLISMLKFGEYIRNHEFWSSQIQQINILPNGELSLYMRVGDQTILFGGMDNMEYKFKKLEAFYRNIVPLQGWNKYSQINLKYSDQIVCTLKENKKKI